MNHRVRLADLNPHLMCVLCGGYYIDASTIIECLHSFCKSCIVKHLESSKYCPICEVQVHKTRPLLNIRPDKTLQNIVYKLVPGLYQKEMQDRRQFYRDRPHYIKPDDYESGGGVADDQKFQSNNDSVILSLSYHDSCNNQDKDLRYLRCPVGVSIKHLHKLIRSKYGINNDVSQVNLLLNGQLLHDDLTLLDILSLYPWRDKDILQLTYIIFQSGLKRQRLETDRLVQETLTKEENNTKRMDDNRETAVRVPENGVKVVEKEIQLQITESGVMSCSEIVNDSNHVEIDSRPTELVSCAIPLNNNNCVNGEVTEPANAHKVAIDLISVEPVNRVNNIESESKIEQSNGLSDAVNVVEEKPFEKPSASEFHAEKTDVAKSTDESNSVPEKVISAKPSAYDQSSSKVAKPSQESAFKPPTSSSMSVKKSEKRPSKIYKTIRTSPNVWNPVITKEKLRPTLIKTDEPRKPCKFFKMRNMPRYLGNPASGVKPLFTNGEDHHVDGAVSLPSPPPTPPTPTSTTIATTSLSKPIITSMPMKPSQSQIVRLNPKTLRPMGSEEQEELRKKMKPATGTNALMTSPFIPRDNHFLQAPNTSPEPKRHNQPLYPKPSLTYSSGFHVSLPPSISLLLNPHQHFRNLKLNRDNGHKSCDTTSNNSSSTITTIPSTTAMITATTTTTTTSSQVTNAIITASVANTATVETTTSTSQVCVSSSNSSLIEQPVVNTVAR